MGTSLHSCAKVRELIKLSFEVVSGVGQRMGVLDVNLYSLWERGGIGVFRPISLNGVFECIFVFDSCVKS